MKTLKKNKSIKHLGKIKNDLLELQKLFRNNTTPKNLTESHNKLVYITKQFYDNPEIKQAVEKLQEMYEQIKALEATKGILEEAHGKICEKEKYVEETIEQLSKFSVGLSGKK